MTESVRERLGAALAGAYRLERELGAGGMATVYLAHDLKHDRKVAVKVLRPELAAVIGAERFLNEIRVTANLQHPHILALYDSGAAGGSLYYVMPFVEGETLDGRLRREKQLGVEDAVRLAGEIAGALDYAHRHGVVHRDIKPANILLQDGGVLVADFGIALALKAAGGDRLTETGLSLGTPHYMSPEQAAGDRDVDARSDVYAVGAVTYEMLAGEPPHTGNTIQAILSRVLTEAPRPLGQLRHSVPAHVAMAVEKALAKVPADRFATAADFQQALRDPRFTLAYSRHGAATRPAAHAHDWWRAWQPWAVAGGLAVAGLGVGRVLAPAVGVDRVVARFRLPVEAERGLTGAPVNSIALSPDGRTMVYVGRSMGATGMLYVRRLDQLHAEPLVGSAGASFPEFSPDGSQVAYFAPGGLHVRPLAGGSPTFLPGVPAAALVRAIWMDPRTLLTTGVEGHLIRVGLDGSTALVLPRDTVRGEQLIAVNSMLPGGRWALAIAATEGVNGALIAVDVTAGRRETILEGPINSVWYADGALLWTQPDGVLLGARFDAARRRFQGAPVTLVQGIRLAVGGPAQAAVSSTGSIVYVPEQPFALMEVDRIGRRSVLADGSRFHSPRYAPDGRRLAVDFPHQGSRDVWTVDLQRRTLTRLSFESDGHDPIWSPDGRWVTYVHGNGIWRRRADGGGEPESVYVRTVLTSALEYTPDGATLITAPTGPSGSQDIALLPVAGEREQTPLVATSFSEQGATLSPNGRWMAYSSDETGRDEVYVRPFPAGDAKVLVSQGGGAEPRWSPDGRALYYHGISAGVPTLMAATVAIRPDGEFGVGAQEALFEISEFEPAAPHANYDVSPDGRRFAMIHQGPLSELVVVLHLTEEVRRLSTGGSR